MEYKCPHGWKRITKLGTITLENSTVRICDNICDSADLCGLTHCEYYDATREGTRRFLGAQARSHTLEGIIEEQTIRQAKKRPN